MSCVRFIPVRTLALAAAALAAAAAPRAFTVLVYDREAVLDGQVWRLLSAHLVHASAYHLMWDVLPLLAIGLLFEDVLARRVWGVLGAAAMGITAGLLILAPELPAYCGLSGVLHGLWAAGSLAALRNERGRPRSLAWLYGGCLVLLAAKLAAEQALGTSLFVDEIALASTPVPLAHVLGAAGGLLGLMLGRAGAGAGMLRYGQLPGDAAISASVAGES